MKRLAFHIILILGILGGLGSLRVEASDCSRTSVGIVPLMDMESGEKYQGYEGGLYPGGTSVRPAAWTQAGKEAAGRIQPLNAAGEPSADGKIVLLSVGMSNTEMEFGWEGGVY